MDIASLRCSKDYDIVFSEDGNIIVDEDSRSVANMSYLDLSLNNDWDLDDSLGMRWITKDGEGLLQGKNKETLIINEIQNKLLFTPGVKSIEEITINKTLSGEIIMSVVIITDNGDKIVIGNDRRE